MALDGLILHSLLHNIAKQCPFKVNKIQQVGEHHYLFHAYNQQRFTLLLVLDAQSARFCLTTQGLSQTHQSSFLTSLKKYCEGATCTSITQHGLDRWFQMEFETTNDVFEKIKVTLYVELMGQYTNAILVNQDNVIIDAHTKIYPDKNSSRFIMSHSPFQKIQSQSKYQLSEPNLKEKIDSWMNVEGVSPLLAKELEYRMHTHENMDDVINECLTSQTLFVNPKQLKQFHVIPLKHLHTPFESNEIHAMMQHMYTQQEHVKNIKAITQDIGKVILRELKKQRNKLVKLEDELSSTSNATYFKHLADYCMSYAYLIKKGDTQLSVPSFEDEDIIVSIPLQPHLSGIDNANAYYRKVQKLNQSIHHIHEQISLTKNMIEYLESCELALSFASVDEALQIKEELVAQRLMKSNKTPSKPSKKQPMKLLKYEAPDFTIFIGKNNIQNDYLTFSFAAKNDMWFHVKDAPSAHVLLKTSEPLNETMIRTAANLCALYSKYAHSSSVEVMYTQISNIKKVPKAPLGLVNVKNYTTIFIDPDASILEHLKR